MPRKTGQGVGNAICRGGCFNEAAARCRGKPHARTAVRLWMQGLQ